MILQKTVTYDKEDLETLLDYTQALTRAKRLFEAEFCGRDPYTGWQVCSRGPTKSITILRPTAITGQARKSQAYQARARRKPIWS